MSLLAYTPSPSIAAALLLLALPLAAQEPPSEPLWPSGAPGAVGTEAADRPRLWLHVLPKAEKPRPAVVICPGGGYGQVNVEHAGHPVAHWLNGLGISAVVLEYRVGPRYHHPAPLQDVQRAIRTVRARAAEWGIDPGKVGLIGFSAGGHLVSTAATHFDAGKAEDPDPLQRPGSRPDFTLLGYPVISLLPEFGSAGSRRHLLGDDPDPALVKSLSNEHQATPQTPPAFLVHGGEDATVSIENPVAYARALIRAGVPVEMHLYEKGPHSFVLGEKYPTISLWPKVAAAWLETLGVLDAGPKPPAASVPAVEPEPAPVLLWPDEAPGAVGKEDADRPRIWPYLPAGAKTPTSAIVVCPGGGYGGLAFNIEGHPVARRLNAMGIAAFVLQYRLGPRYHHPAPITDAHRAIRLVRARAKEWNLDPAKVGIMGFSAGGHLTSTAATIFDDGDPKSADPIEREGCRPDFAVPVYPVVSMVESCVHAGSRANLLGKDYDPKLAEALSLERRVTARTPPVFLIHGADDTGVPPENSLLLYEALRKAKIPVELHLFAHGKHGFGLGTRFGENPPGPVAMWPELLEAWLRTHGW